MLKDSLGWGFLLWLIGYILGFIVYFLVPVALIGWVIMPIGVAVTLWVSIDRVKSWSFRYYCLLALVWALTAVLLDFLLIVKLLNPADGYYKLDVYLYYALTLLIPIIVGWAKHVKHP